ncbi:Holliday junction resolvase RuvX [candidate division KSB3 bacterium]|uniref:Putative pre-16S rRNA nuclease n=1 Tax=candidate division KSB3 bacterium TaxID=2044937 RepID=A0A2G6E4R4_9BACT|nr:MAG: Holliday junction resolvase RuvX [candidate division KSB3 bacterium]PIE29373.1 MAG: Holliday junction resolvase RuvX [candidate division KSB3 bacterium]
MGRILGLDVGDKTIGMAVSDELKWTAQAAGSIRRAGKKTDFPAIINFAQENQVEEIVIGLPKNMDNSLGEQAKKVLTFSRRLQGRLGADVKVTLWDERLSSSAAEKTLIAANVTRKKRKHVIDTMAAVLILQGYLDSLSP